MKSLLIAALFLAIVLGALMLGELIAPVSECHEYISERFEDNPNGC